MLQLRKYILNVAIFFLMVVPNFAFTDNNINSLSLGEIIQALENSSQSNEQNRLMALLRETIRTKFLPGIFSEYQKNPTLKLGELKAKDFFDNLEKFQLFQSGSKQVIQLDPEREDDFYLTSKGLGLINDATLVNDPNTLVALILHVFLGASGWQDENYQLSLAILSYEASLRTKQPGGIQKIDHQKLFPSNSDKLNRPTEKNYKFNQKLNNKNSSLQKSGGGFTGVGGGGDASSLKTKLLMYSYTFTLSEISLSQFCRKRWEEPTRFVQDIQNVEIESLNNFNSVQIEKFANSSFKILIPKVPTHMTSITELTARISIYYLCKGIENAKER